jgi:hypothetical protein
MRKNIVIYCPEQSQFKYLDPLHNKIKSIRFTAEDINNELPLFTSLLVDHQNKQVLMVNNGYQSSSNIIPSSNILWFCANSKQISLLSQLPMPRLKSICEIIEGDAIYLMGGVLTTSELRTNSCIRIALENGQP